MALEWLTRKPRGLVKRFESNCDLARSLRAIRQPVIIAAPRPFSCLYTVCVSRNVVLCYNVDSSTSPVNSVLDLHRRRRGPSPGYFVEWGAYLPPKQAAIVSLIDAGQRTKRDMYDKLGVVMHEMKSLQMDWWILRINVRDSSDWGVPHALAGEKIHLEDVGNPDQDFCRAGL